ncbi:MAG: hypothetical protein K2X61_02570 [Caulobacteraceae bacterium]|nr:hypothetical protein [Caulobacteraceae bacterium]
MADLGYKAGFEEGYRLIKGNNVVVPVCPVAPATPVGRTAYQMGLMKGIEKAGGPKLK